MYLLSEKNKTKKGEGMKHLTFLGSGKEGLKMLDASFLWKNYSRSMQKRRPGIELRHNAFGRYVSNSDIFIFGRSALIGQMQGEHFCVSHFAPSSKKEGVQILKEVRRQTKVVFAVTSDLAKMMEKLGYQKKGETVTPFRGAQVKKIIFS